MFLNETPGAKTKSNFTYSLLSVVELTIRLIRTQCESARVGIRLSA